MLALEIVVTEMIDRNASDRNSSDGNVDYRKRKASEQECYLYH